MIDIVTANTPLLTAVVANPAGEIFELDGYAAVGMSGALMRPLARASTRPLPYGSELMFLPDRHPVAMNLDTGRIETLKENPHVAGEPIHPVAAFNSPGYAITAACAYREQRTARVLPLFSYGALGWWHGKFRSAVLQVDSEPRQDLRRMSHERVAAGIARMRRQLPANRLRQHLEKCALEYGCPAGKNFFLGRYEAPLPAAKHCNARCLGCLSKQDGTSIPHSQDRIGFTPSPRELAEVALAHIGRVKRAVVSFGQGCEGDPLLASAVIGPAIGLIRAATDAGTINMNTNGSLPQALAKLLAAGLDSVRISLNSVRPPCYEAYFRPRGYRFADVLASIETALSGGGFVAVNYLNSPGVTDTPEELDAFRTFLERYPIHMVQWRNLNFDPLRYYRRMRQAAPLGSPLGMETLIGAVRDEFPQVMHGYFNPPKEKY